MAYLDTRVTGFRYLRHHIPSENVSEATYTFPNHQTFTAADCYQMIDAWNRQGGLDWKYTFVGVDYPA